jgi:hypothetical protein
MLFSGPVPRLKLAVIADDNTAGAMFSEAKVLFMLLKISFPVYK